MVELVRDQDHQVPEQAERAANELRAHLESIDPESTEDPDGFWAAFLDDVTAGDYT